MPAITPPLSPPLSPPAAAAEARDGFAPADATPLHRSPVALRVEAAGPASAGAAVLADERAELLPLAAVADWLACGAVELLPARVTPAVAPLTRAVTEFRGAVAGCVRAADGVRVADGVRCACVVERCGRAAVFDWPTAPLVVADAERAGAGVEACGWAGDAAAGAVAGAGAAAVAAAGPALGAAGVGDADGAGAGDAVDAGGVAGVAGVP